MLIHLLHSSTRVDHTHTLHVLILLLFMKASKPQGPTKSPSAGSLKGFPVTHFDWEKKEGMGSEGEMGSFDRFVSFSEQGKGHDTECFRSDQ